MKEIIKRLLKNDDFLLLIKKLLINDVVDLSMQGLDDEALKQLESRFFLKYELFDKNGIDFEEFKSKTLK